MKNLGFLSLTFVFLVLASCEDQSIKEIANTATQEKVMSILKSSFGVNTIIEKTDVSSEYVWEKSESIYSSYIDKNKLNLESAITILYAGDYKLLIIPFIENSSKNLLVNINKTNEIYKIFTMEVSFAEKTLKSIKFQRLTSEIMASYNVVDGLLTSDEVISRELGPRKENETFNQCFARNWTSFCDGFVGCVAEATNPIVVAAAIAIECSSSPS